MALQLMCHLGKGVTNDGARLASLFMRSQQAAGDMTGEGDAAERARPVFLEDRPEGDRVVPMAAKLPLEADAQRLDEPLHLPAGPHTF